MGADAFEDREFPEFLVVKFRGTVRGVDVLSKEPYLASYFKAWFREARGVGILSLGCLSVGHLGLEGSVEGWQSFDECDIIWGQRYLFWSWANVGKELEVESVVREEGANSEGGSDGVVVCELGEGQE